MNIRIAVLTVGIVFLFCADKVYTEELTETKEKIFLLQDFEQETFEGGVWEEFMEDRHTTFVGSKSSLVKYGEEGHSFALDYDFRSDNDLVGGIWLHVSGYDFSGYQYFGFWVKGEPAVGYSKIIGITFEDKKGKIVTVMNAKTGNDWYKVEIPLKSLKLENLSELVEINVFIDKRYIDQTGGRTYFDNFYLR
ncbi:MAG: hypothetical protein P9M06_01560 [Candidatus Saelkia tenebricola]|nr:hypothetical protein [Candidatus Saelkia tenebricola]